MHPDVTTFLAAAPEAQRPILEALRQMVHEVLPSVTEEFKWGRPVFRTTHDIIYFKSSKAYVTLGFFDASGLEDPEGLLEGTGRQMRHYKIRNAAALDAAPLRLWLQQAAR